MKSSCHLLRCRRRSAMSAPSARTNTRATAGITRWSGSSGTGLYRTDIPLNPLTAADRRRIAALLTRLAIAPLARRSFLSLSYGERRLVLLARVLASQPKLLLLDELLNGLDETNHGRALRWLEATKRSAMPWVLATHRVEDVPKSATHALVLEHGRVVYRGRVAQCAARQMVERARARSRPTVRSLQNSNPGVPPVPCFDSPGLRSISMSGGAGKSIVRGSSG